MVTEYGYHFVMNDYHLSALDVALSNMDQQGARCPCNQVPCIVRRSLSMEHGYVLHIRRIMSKRCREDKVEMELY